jgi:hypothetical protein
MSDSAGDQTPSHQKHFSVFNIDTKKRKGDAMGDEGVTLERLAEMMNNNKVELLQEIKAKADIHSEQIKNLRDEIGSKIEVVDQRVGNLESAVGENTKQIDGIQLCVNDLEQAAIASHMDIVGIATPLVEESKADLKSFVHQLFESYEISVEPSQVEHVFARAIRDDKRVITVIFSSISVKVSVMRTNRASNDARKIYFDHRLTPKNRQLFNAARIAVKEKKIKSSFVAAGRVMVEKFDGSRTRIVSPDDVTKFPSALQHNQQPRSTQATSMRH